MPNTKCYCEGCRSTGKNLKSCIHATPFESLHDPICIYCDKPIRYGQVPGHCERMLQSHNQTMQKIAELFPPVVSTEQLLLIAA